VAHLVLGQAEVHDLHVARGQDHDVRGLHVAVDDAVSVRVVERLRDVAHDPDRLRPGEEALVVQDRGERPALEVLERDVEEAGLGIAVDVVDHDDAGMRQPRRHPRLHEEAPLEVVALLVGDREDETHDLERDRPVERGVAALVDDAHHPAPELRADLVAADPGRRLLGAHAGAGGRTIVLGAAGAWPMRCSTLGEERARILP
jgi:hypothetical protein